MEKPLEFGLNGDIIFNSEEQDKLKNRFKEKANGILESAFNKKYNRNTLQNVPKWFWLILAFFAYDNVLNWMSHPLIMMMFMLTLVMTGYVLATGQTKKVWRVYSFVQGYVMAMVLGSQKPSIGDIFKSDKVEEKVVEKKQ